VQPLLGRAGLYWHWPPRVSLRRHDPAGDELVCTRIEEQQAAHMHGAAISQGCQAPQFRLELCGCPLRVWSAAKLVGAHRMKHICLKELSQLHNVCDAAGTRFQAPSVLLGKPAPFRWPSRRSDQAAVTMRIYAWLASCKRALLSWLRAAGGALQTPCLKAKPLKHARSSSCKILRFTANHRR
jgi:hypothetical protein